VLSPYHTVKLADGVNVVALTAERNCILVQQFRYPVGQVLFEIPAGHIEPAEPTESAARRELAEETGYHSGSWYYLGSTFIMASRLTSRAHNFLAVDVVAGARRCADAAEIIEVHEIAWQTLLMSISSGKPLVAEANQLAAIFLARQFAIGRPELRI
jgi:ADP-ribose pyrophosphatase